MPSSGYQGQLQSADELVHFLKLSPWTRPDALEMVEIVLSVRTRHSSPVWSPVGDPIHVQSLRYEEPERCRTSVIHTE